jgi:polyhydroxyalkanoate synthesis regulator phasin
MGEFDNDPDLRPGQQNDERDELLAELDALLDRQRVSEGMTPELRQTVRKYVAEHEGEIEWLREQCRKLEDGSMSPDDAQKWFEAFVAMERENSA